jgi:plastocyanin
MTQSRMKTSEEGLPRRRGGVVLLAALTVTGLAAGVLVPGGGASSRAKQVPSHSKATTHVAVAATEYAFTLSKHRVPIGTVIFTVTNKGRVSHNFKIGGKRTPLLPPGRSATLRVTFLKSGRYPYLSTLPGQAAAGMKGVLSVGPTPGATTPTTTATPTTTTALPSTTVGAANTTVTVDLFDTNGPPHIVLSQLTIPSGTVTFVIRNKCQFQCSFHLEGIKAGRILEPGESETWTVSLPPGTYGYHCDVDPGMKGSFTVTG